MGRRRVLVAAAATLAVIGGSGVAAVSPAAAASAPTGASSWNFLTNSTRDKLVVGMGDSYMSGEGGTYLGKNYGRLGTGAWRIPAYGSSLQQTYPDDYTGLPGDGCHRSTSASMHWNAAGYAGVNLACSGAQTHTFTNTDNQFKPGFNFNAQGTDQSSQLQKLAQSARAAGDTISVVQVSIGGNDMGFSKVITDCATRFITPTQDACYKTADTPGSVLNTAMNSLPQVTTNVAMALSNVRTAMKQGGQADGTYTLTYQIPPIVVPQANQMWPPLGGDHAYGRQNSGGCPFTDGDLSFFYQKLAPGLRDAMLQGLRQAKEGVLKDVPVVVVEPSFAGHELCNATNPPKLDPNGNINTTTPSWNQYQGRGGAWATPVIMVGVVAPQSVSYTKFMYPSLMKAVSNSLLDAGTLPMHPNYWGQRAIASCQNQVATNPAFRGQIVSCSPSVVGADNLTQDALGRPSMTVVKTGTQ